MDKLNLPEYSFRIFRSGKDIWYIFDVFRKKKIRLTPEEWVRQHILRYLEEEKGVPRTLVSVESGVKINRLERRYDAVIYDRLAKPLILIECKAPGVAIQQSTFDQIVSYNTTLRAKYLLVTNGMKHYFCKMDPSLHQFVFLEDIPHYRSL